MGCTDSKIEVKTETQKDFFTNFEDSLGYSALRLRDIDNTFHRYSFSSLVPYENLAKALQNLKVPFSSYNFFYDKLILRRNSSKTVMYSRKLLCCLGILLGKGSETEKIKLLFQNYDIETNHVLDINEIKTLVSDVFFISLELIPESLYEKEPNSDLRIYIDELKYIMPSMIDFYVYCFVESNNIVDFKVYTDVFHRKEVRKLVNTYELREYCMGIKKKYSNSKKHQLNQGLAGFMRGLVTQSAQIDKIKPLG